MGTLLNSCSCVLPTLLPSNFVGFAHRQSYRLSMVFQVHLEKPQGRSIVWKELPESESGLEFKISEPFLMIMSNTVAGD